MVDQSIQTARKFISDELSLIYPKDEVLSLSRIILHESTGLSRTDILTHPEKTISRTSWHKISKICAELKENRPIQYILGKTEFFGVTLKVDENTLIPRQETEELADLIIKEQGHREINLIDLGTGSGAIAIALSVNLKLARITASDISVEALDIARENSSQNKCEITFIHDDILNSNLRNESYDLIVSNPPYVRESEKRAMHRNVLDFEPHAALFVSDDDPLIYYRAIGRLGRKILRTGGFLYLEINEAFGKDIAAMLDEFKYRDIRILQDINNKDRIISAVKPL